MKGRGYQTSGDSPSVHEHAWGWREGGASTQVVDRMRGRSGRANRFREHRSSRRRNKASARLVRTSIPFDSCVFSHRSCPRASFTREKAAGCGEVSQLGRRAMTETNGWGGRAFVCCSAAERRAASGGAHDTSGLLERAESKEQATMDQPSWMQNTGQAAAPGAAAGGAATQQSAASPSGDA